METFNLGQLTKEMVASRLREMEDPCAVAARILEDALTSALRNAKGFGPGEKEMVSEACHGAMIGILLRHQDLSHGAVQVLRAACAAAQALSLDPTEFMTLAIEGLARIRNVAPPEQLHEMIYALEAEFMGAGEVFRELCQAPVSPKIAGP
jgi:hypothetical protein